MNRKNAIIGVAGIIILLAVILTVQAMSAKKTANISFYAMDTYMSLSVTGKNAEKIAELIEADVMALDALLSTGSSDSEISKLNLAGTLTVSPVTADILEKADEYRQFTDGDFNILIYPIVREWGFPDKNYKVPDAGTLSVLCDELAASSVTVDRNSGTVTLSDNAMADLGGIAKGYATSRIVDILKENNAENALINLGGNVYAYNTKEGNKTWRIAVKSPTEGDKYLGTIDAVDLAAITSGGYERYFEDNGKRYHHIINPGTGYPAESGIASVTVVSPDATLADVLSTALFVKGLDGSVAFWKKNSSLFDFVIYTEDGKLYITEGIRDAFSSELEYEVIEK